MATARPPTEATTIAEHGFYRVVEAARDDLRFLQERWPDRASAESVAVIARLRRLAAPDGDAEAAMQAVFAAYGGAPLVPQRVRQRLERYAWDQLGGRPWPERDPAEDLEEPAIVRKARRSRGTRAQRGQATGTAAP